MDVSLEYGYNCRSRNECPLQNKCLPPTSIYRAKFENDLNDEKKFYSVVSETLFKKRYRYEKKEFSYVKYRNSTKLSKYIRQLKDLNITLKNSCKI